ncbi:MAG TPA: tetratricopeptide repeat protein, partial [bacterium]|nr:tetratricopeptide repeat protein [bacterium]
QADWRELRAHWGRAEPAERAELAVRVSDAFLRLPVEEQRADLLVGAEATLAAGRTDLALDLVEGAPLADHPDGVLTVRIQALARLGRVEAVAQLVREQAERRPRAVAEALRREEGRLLPLAAAALRSGAPAAGRIVFEHLAKLEPPLAYRLANLGLCLRQLGDLADAERTYRLALQRFPDDAALWNDFGLLLRAQGRITEALEAFRRGVAIDMALPEPRRGRGPAITNLMHWEALHPGEQRDDPLPNALFSLRRRERAVMLQRLCLDVQLDRLQRAATNRGRAVAPDRGER